MPYNLLVPRRMAGSLWWRNHGVDDFGKFSVWLSTHQQSPVDDKCWRTIDAELLCQRQIGFDLRQMAVGGDTALELRAVNSNRGSIVAKGG